MSKSSILGIVCLIALATTACSSEPPRPLAMADYFPLRDGATWTFRVDLAGASYEERWTAEAMQTAGPGQGHTFVVGWEQRFTTAGDTEFQVGFDDVDHYIVSADGSRVAHHRWCTDRPPNPVPGWRLDLEQDEGSWLLRSDAKLGVPIEVHRPPGAGLEETIIHTLAGRGESVTVPAGTFENCRHIRIEESTGGGSGDLPPVTREVTVDWWFAPRIGPVRRRTVSRTDGELAPHVEDRVLLEYRIP